jgi:hypothetical protein
MIPRRGLEIFWDLRVLQDATRVADLSGNGRHLLIPSAPANPTQVSEGFLFDGNDYLDSQLEYAGPVGFFPAGSQAWTVSVLARAASGGTNSTIVARAATGTSYGFGIVAATDGKLRATLRGLSQVIMDHDTKWHLVSLRYHGDGTASVTVDRFLVHGSIGIGTGAEPTGQRLIIGARLNGTDSFLLNGSKVAFVGVWSRVLGVSELQKLFGGIQARFGTSGLIVGT